MRRIKHAHSSTTRVRSRKNARATSGAWRIGTSLAFLLLSAGCGGGESTEPLDGEPITAGVDLGEKEAAPASFQDCARVPVAARQTGQRHVRDFGAVPDDNHDDAAAIQRAIDATKAGATLILNPGRYLISHSLRVRNPGITITGPGATIHGTNPDDQALIIYADNTTVSSLTFTAVTDRRRSAAWHWRIAVVGQTRDGSRPVRNTVIRDNRIVNAGAPGTATANSASSGGILLHHAYDFLVSGNTVVRTLADGIHVTGGSHDGRVLNNTVRETGDDMISVVSYAHQTSDLISASTLKAHWDQLVDTALVRNVLIAGNHVSGQYWGRGISVVGGQSITIAKNTIENVPRGAGVLIAREANYQSFGVENVVVDGNLIREVQTKNPPYDYRNKFLSSGPTGHAAVEIHSGLFEDEAASTSLRQMLGVRNVMVRNNVIEHASVNASRLGVPMHWTMHVTYSDGRTQERDIVPGLVRNAGFINNRFNRVSEEPLRVLEPNLKNTGLFCGSNQKDGVGYRPAACKTVQQPAATGAPLNCSSDGVLR
jgi:hypothetical protein